MKPTLRRLLETPDLKICTRCLTVNPSSAMYRPGMCKKCSNEKSREWKIKKFGPSRVKLTDEELANRRKERERLRSKTGWTTGEVRAYKSAKTAMVEVTKKAWFSRPKRFYHNGKVFDTEFERDEYVRGWREYREWCAEHRDDIKRAAAQRRKTVRNPQTPEKVAAHEERKRRAAQTKRERQRWKDIKKRKRGIEGKRLPWDFEEKQLAAQEGCCFYCRVEIGDDYHLDHVLPVAKGGQHHPDNLVIACPACNISKRDLMPWEFSFDLMQAA